MRPHTLTPSLLGQLQGSTSSSRAAPRRKAALAVLLAGLVFAGHSPAQTQPQAQTPGQTPGAARAAAAAAANPALPPRVGAGAPRAPAAAASAPAASAPAPAASASALTASDGADRAQLDRTQIVGNRELPKVLYIVPWKRPIVGTMERPVKSVLDEVFAPIDREVLRRQVRYESQIRTAGEAALEAANNAATIPPK